MSDNIIETSQPIQEALIEEYSSTRKDMWSRLKKNPNRWLWLGLSVVLVSLLLSLPYLFFGSYLMLYLVGMLIIALIVIYLGFPSISKYSKPSKLNRFVFLFNGILIICSLYHILNYDKHVLVDYLERPDDFPYETITRDIENPLLKDTESFTVLVNSTGSLKFRPDFKSLATAAHKGSKIYQMRSLREFTPFTIYYGADSNGKTGEIKGKRTVHGWFGSTSTDFVIKMEK